MTDVRHAFLINDEQARVLFYHGERVRLFHYLLSSNDLMPESPFFTGDIKSNLDAEWVIDVYAIRDHRQSTNNGYDKLTGLRIASSEEFEANSKVVEEWLATADRGLVETAT